MKRWAIVTVLLYGVMLLLLTVPAILFFGLQWDKSPVGGWELAGGILKDAVGVFSQWGYWLWFGVMLLAQALLLLVPVAVAERRPRPRRRLALAKVVTGLLLANLFLAGMLSLAVVVWGDDTGEFFEALGKLTLRGVNAMPGLSSAASAMGINNDESVFAVLNIIGMVVILWMVWGFLFYRSARADDPSALSSRAMRWLVRGSILEVLVAVPSHLVVRARGDCCAPVGTFWGMACGVSVMLMAFGPGIFFLFASRMRRLRPKPEDAGRGDLSVPPPLPH
jgi:hypothetical protein